MMLQLNDDGVLDKVDEENLITVDENELDELIDRHNKLSDENKQLKNENEQLKQQIKDIEKVKDGFYDKVFSLINQFIEYNQLKVGNHDDVVDNLRELRKELEGDVE